MDGGREGGRAGRREKHGDGDEGRGTRDRGEEGKDGRLPLKGWRCDCARESSTKLEQAPS